MFDDIIKRVRALIYIRVILVTILLGSFYAFRIEYERLIHPSVFSSFIVVLYFLTIIYALVLRSIKTEQQLKAFAYTQIIIDVTAEVFLLYLTGGIGSMFSFMFPLSIISAGIVLNRRACYIFATLSSLLYGTLLDLQFYGVISTGALSYFTERDYFYNIFAHITAFYVIAFLSGYLSDKLQRLTRTLEEKNSVLSDLKVFSEYIIESMPSGVFTTDLNRKILTYNSTAEEITKLDHDLVIGKTLESVFPFLNVNQQPLERIDAGMDCQGRILQIGMRLSPLRDSIGEPIGMIGVFQDLTELKAMEAEVKRKEKWAFIGELSASIAHELRNPLASLRASIEMIHGKGLSEEHAERMMKIALSEMDRLNGIITDFLIYARPRELHVELFDLHSSLRDLTILLQNSVPDEKNIKVSSELQGPLIIKGDPEQIRQLCWNLGLNAIDALSDSGRVDVFTRKNNNTVEILFRDSGMGISRDDMEKIFYPFFTTKENGTGLGLSISMKVAEEHGGKITAESEGTDMGTTFKVILPGEAQEVKNLKLKVGN